MNKIKTVVLLIVAIVITAIATEKILIKNIKVDAVDEVDRGIVTLDINGQLYDYEYKYIEIDTTGSCTTMSISTSKLIEVFYNKLLTKSSKYVIM